MRKLIGIVFGLALIFASGQALAQSACANLPQGAVPTAGQWANCFQQKQDYLGAAPLLLTGGVMGGELVTAPSTTTSSGFNLPPGAAPTSPINGDMWTTPAGLYVQIAGITVGPLGSSSIAIGTPITGGTPVGPLLVGAGNLLAEGTLSGSTTELLTVSGSLTVGDCLNVGSLLDATDSGSPCGSGGGGSVSSVADSGDGTTVTTPTTGAVKIKVVNLLIAGSGSGTTTFASANTGATNYTETWPAASGIPDLIALAQPLTNKTISGSSNTITNIGNSSLTNSTISGIPLGSTLNTLTFGTHLAAGGTTYNGAANVTITSDATSANTASTIMARNSSGNVAFGTATGSLAGHASLDLPLAGGYMSGEINAAASTTANAGLNLGQGAAPTSPINGDFWITSAGAYVQVNGVTEGPLGSSGSGGFSQEAKGTVTYTTNGNIMSGIAGYFTPRRTGNMQLSVFAQVYFGGGSAGGWTLKYGTGTAPSEGASATGTTCGLELPAPSYSGSIALSCDVALSIGTTYWFDLEGNTIATNIGLGGTVALANEF